MPKDNKSHTQAHIERLTKSTADLERRIAKAKKTYGENNETANKAIGELQRSVDADHLELEILLTPRGRSDFLLPSMVADELNMDLELVQTLIRSGEVPTEQVGDGATYRLMIRREHLTLFESIDIEKALALAQQPYNEVYRLAMITFWSGDVEEIERYVRRLASTNPRGARTLAYEAAFVLAYRSITDLSNDATSIFEQHDRGITLNFMRFPEFRKHLSVLLKDVKLNSPAQQYVEETIGGLEISEDAYNPFAPADLDLTPEYKADDLAYQAQEEIDDKKSQRLLERALQLDPKCVAAHILKGMRFTEDPRKRLEIYQAAASYEEAAFNELLTAEKAYLETLPLEHRALNMWGNVDARDYMRCRHLIGLTLFELGNVAAAINEFEFLISVNNNDNQGVRDILAAAYFKTGNYKGIKRLLREYKDCAGAYQSYNKALYQYATARTRIDIAERYLNEAFQENSYVPLFLLEVIEMPEQLPASYNMRGQAEAVLYVNDMAEAWENVPGAIDWLYDSVMFAFAEGINRKHDEDLKARLGRMPPVDWVVV